MDKEIRRHESVGCQTAQRVGKDIGRIDVGKPSAQGDEFKKVVGLSQKKAAVAHVMNQQLCSMPRAVIIWVCPVQRIAIGLNC